MTRRAFVAPLAGAAAAPKTLPAAMEFDWYHSLTSVYSVSIETAPSLITQREIARSALVARQSQIWFAKEVQRTCSALNSHRA